MLQACHVAAAAVDGRHASLMSSLLLLLLFAALQARCIC
jgi:hypothetical protein